MSHLLRAEAILLLLTFLPLFQCCFSIPQTDYSFKCSDEAKYDPHSPFEPNLFELLHSLKKRADPDGSFFNASEGENTNRVFGSGLCAADISLHDCQSCIEFASTEITAQACPLSKSAITWNDRCLLQYSNEQFLLLLKFQDALTYKSNSRDLGVSLFFFITQLSQNMEPVPSTHMSAFGQMWLGLQQLVVGTVQCRTDLLRFDCMNCLLGLLNATSEFSDCRSEFSDCRGHALSREAPDSRCSYKLDFSATSPDNPTDSPPQVPVDANSVTTSRRTAGSSISWGYTIAIVVSMTLASILIIYTGAACLFKRQKEKEDHRVVPESGSTEPSEWGRRQPLIFSLDKILTATCNFSDANKIRESSFGHVYKGTLLDGKEIAVKRLSWNSGQGEQLKNEVALTAQLDHRNLVRLLGYCVEGGEKLLVYEYVSNNGLDHILSDPAKRGQLGWNTRYMIIKEIAKGLLYLHEGTLLRILHQDLKASNILLDSESCPKISEFGFAKLLRGNQAAGTYGRMASEHVMHEQLSVKTDVFCFGVLAIEIVKGRKRSNFTQSDQAQDLLHCTWKQWREGKVLELMDPSVVESCSVTEVLRCIHVALLCVQENPDDRPTMPFVDLMLNGGGTITQQPNSPSMLFIGSSLARSNPTSS